MRWIAVLAAVGSSCTSDGQSRSNRTAVERAIEHAVGERTGVAARARCVWLPPRCEVQLPDGDALVVRIGRNAEGEVTWSLAGALVVAAEIEAYLEDALVDLGAPQAARCGARIRAVAIGERVECALEHGGKAFVVVDGDGSTMVEIVLDPAVGAVRTEAVSVEREAELLDMSRTLDHGDDEVDDD